MSSFRITTLWMEVHPMGLVELEVMGRVEGGVGIGPRAWSYRDFVVRVFTRAPCLG